MGSFGLFLVGSFFRLLLSSVIVSLMGSSADSGQLNCQFPFGLGLLPLVILLQASIQAWKLELHPTLLLGLEPHSYYLIQNLFHA